MSPSIAMSSTRARKVSAATLRQSSPIGREDQVPALVPGDELADLARMSRLVHRR